MRFTEECIVVQASSPTLRASQCNCQLIPISRDPQSRATRAVCSYFTQNETNVILNLQDLGCLVLVHASMLALLFMWSSFSAEALVRTRNDIRFVSVLHPPVYFVPNNKLHLFELLHLFKNTSLCTIMIKARIKQYYIICYYTSFVQKTILANCK